MILPRKVSIYNNVRIEIAGFEPDAGVTEYHAMLHIVETNKSFSEQLSDIQLAYSQILSGFSHNVKPVFRRFFLSDTANQSKLLEEYPVIAGEDPQSPDNQCSVFQEIAGHARNDRVASSIIQQPPLDGSKIALWVYFLSDIEVEAYNKGVIAKHNNYCHIWTAGRFALQPESYSQTESILQEYVDDLKKEGCTLENNCIRTWFFVRNIDTNYNGMVQARKSFFEKHHLNNNTHYISSTGIEGCLADPCKQVIFDAYAIKGLQEGQLKFLYAPTHLSPTYKYGVTFERGVCIEYGDRCHVIISGTASIDNQGNIVAPDDIAGQTHRMLENVEALLTEAGASFEDVMHWIVYLRDIADYSTTDSFFRERFKNTPYIIVLAPVCRTGWLIEVECVAVVENKNSLYQDL